jgi:hypothetical protein
MKTLLKLILILAVIGVIAYAAYRYYLPSRIAESLKSGQTSALVPDEIQEKVNALKTKIANDMGVLPHLMVEASIDFDDLRTMLNRLDPDEVSSTLREMSYVSINSTDQVFDIVIKNVNIEGYELEAFRSMFVRNSSVEEIRKAMEKVREHDFLITMSMPVAKEVAKDLLESSRLEIEKQLEALEARPQ